MHHSIQVTSVTKLPYLQCSMRYPKTHVGGSDLDGLGYIKCTTFQLNSKTKVFGDQPIDQN